MMKPAVIVPEDQPFTLATLPPSRAQTRLALAVTLTFLGILLILARELSNIQLGRIDAFVPTYSTAIFINEFAILRSRALLVIANGYIFAALMVIPWMLTFPGVLAPDGLLGAGPQSANWFAILRYAGFPAFVVTYALMKDADPKGQWRRGAAILSSVAATAAAVSAATVLVTAGDAYSPQKANLTAIPPAYRREPWAFVSLIPREGILFGGCFEAGNCSPAATDHHGSSMGHRSTFDTASLPFGVGGYQKIPALVAPPAFFKSGLAKQI